MRKGLIVVVASIAALAGAAVYFAAPAPAASGNPALVVVVDGSPAEVLGRWRAASPHEFLRHEAAGAGLDGVSGRFTIKDEGGGIRDDRTALWLAGEKVLVISTQVRPSGTRTEVEMSAELPPSSLIRAPALSAQDRTLMAALAGRVASDYAATLLGGQAPANPAASAHAVEAAFGLDGRSREAFETRVRDAVKAVLGPRDEAPDASDPDVVTTEDETNFGTPVADESEAEAPDRAEADMPEPDSVTREEPETDKPEPAGNDD